MYWVVAAIVAGWFAFPSAQVLDRVVAVVAGSAITESDVEAALGLGVVDAQGPDRLASGTQRMIDRQLMLAEVARFPPTPPPEPAISELVATMKGRAGAGFGSLMQRTGLDEQRVHELARDTLRIQAYIDQRFGTSVQVSAQDARDYYETHRAEFTRNGVLAPFEEVESEAREAASTEARRTAVARWLEDLRMRGNVTLTPRREQP